jgi:poly-gamma-glutamate synthesis protein (capsule biosynthesis protein)
LGVAPALRGADLAIVNLESPLVPASRCLPGGTVSRPRLCGDPRGVAALRAAGIDAVTLANNHALDAGLAGLRHTARLLRRAGIVPLGMEAARRGTPRAERLGPLTVVAVSLTVAAHPPGSRVPLPSPAALAAAIRRARRRHPRRPVLVLAHLGRELHPHPGPRERAYGRAAVGAGAAAVVLHGAHVRRALVHDRGVPVHLGLGNLLFDQRDPRTRVGELLGLAFLAGPSFGSSSGSSPGPVRVHARCCVDSLAATPVQCP